MRNYHVAPLPACIALVLTISYMNETKGRNRDRYDTWRVREKCKVARVNQ